MERLKSVLADKIIDISSENDASTKTLLDKVNRFRDFSFACEALMRKYPDIENELIRMIDSDDFDTRAASARVNKVISDAESGIPYVYPSQEIQKEENHEVVPEAVISVPKPDLVILEPASDDDLPFHLDASVQGDVKTEEPQVVDEDYHPETTAFPEAEGHAEDSVASSAYKNKEDLDFEYATANPSAKRTKQIVLVAVSVIGAVLLCILIFKFWKIALILVAIVLLAGVAFWFLTNKKNNSDTE
ncbi:MAG: hypothetical protein QM654_10445 [Dysgonamonadaceae bacterium]